MERYEKVFKIKGYDDFICTNKACRDCCCHGVDWLIDIDDKTYEKYKKLKTEFGERILNQIVKSKMPNGKEAHVMKLNKNNECVFCKDYLCEIQRTLGAEYLSRTCMIYPRLIKKYNHIMEMSLTISCPEVVKLILFNKEKIGFSTELVKRSMLPFKSKWSLNPEVKTGITTEQCEIVRNASVDIIQNRELTLWQRIAYLGIFSRSAATEPEKSAITYVENMNSGMIVDSLNNLSLADIDARNDLILSAIRTLPTIFRRVEVTHFANFDLYNRVVDAFLKASKKDESPFTPQKINQLKSSLLDPYIRENEHVFENYLVVEIFNYSYPVKNDSVYSAYMGLILKYILLQVFIIMVYRDKTELTEDEIVNCIYYFSKFIDHSESKINLIGDITKNSPLISLATMVSLVMY